MGKLNVAKVKAAKAPGRYQDGRGLMLFVRASGTRSWVLRTMVNGRRHEMGLGSLLDVSLAEAREKADNLRKALKAGETPASIRRANTYHGAPTFAETAIRAHGERLDGWRNPKHAAQWISSLERYAFPTIGELPIDAVATADIHGALAPIWLSKQETARRVCQRIGTVLEWAHAKGYREHPAPMKAVLAGLKKQDRRDNHFAACPYDQLPDVYAGLCKSGGMGALALRFTILTAARSGEVRGACWQEIDIGNATWTVPADRMKTGREHIVALSTPTIEILDEVAAINQCHPSSIIFPGQRQKPMSDATMAKALRTVKDEGYTVHGMRSAFRDWAAEKTSHDGAVVEAALSHTVRNKVEAAYRRTNYLEKRRLLMDDWAIFCCAYISGNRDG